MRIRSTKPEFWSSRTVCEVDWEHRFVLKGLESYVDDNGVGKDDIELICGDVWKRDLAREGSRTLARVSAALSSLSQAGLVWRYEVEGEHLLFVSCWESIQKIDRPSAGRFPRPDGTWNYGESKIRECVASPREPSRGLDAGTGEQGNRGTGEQTLSSAHADAFEQWWKRYPRKVGKGQARKAYASALKKVSADELAEAAEAFAGRVHRSGTEDRFIPHPATWLNGERWTDSPVEDGSGEQFSGVEGWMNA